MKIFFLWSKFQNAVTLYLLGVEWRQTTWAKLLPTPDKTGRFLRVCEHCILRVVLVLHKRFGYPQMSNLHKRLGYSQISNYGALQILQIMFLFELINCLAR